MDPPSSKAQWPALGVESEATEERRQSSIATPGDAWFSNDRTDVLNKNAVETLPTQQVCRTASAILALVQVSVLVTFPPADFIDSPTRIS